MTTTQASGWPIGGGEMGARIRVFEWAATPLGSIDTWPQGVRTAAELMLAMRQPACIWWGPGSSTTTST